MKAGNGHLRLATFLSLAVLQTSVVAETGMRMPMDEMRKGAEMAQQGHGGGIVGMAVVDLAKAIRERRLSSREVVQAHIGRIDSLNGALNAVVALDRANALRRAEQADAALVRGEVWGPLHGIPFTIKDVFSTKGLRTTAGYPPLKDNVPDANAVVVQRLLDAGAILMGKTNTPSLAMDMQTTNELFGTTRNVVDTQWTAGGSSGGAAVAIAAGMTPFEIGSDLAGSVRLPAAFNGVLGLRPTFGLVSMRGHVPPRPEEINGIRRMATPGPLARNLDDLELLLKILAGPGEGDHRLAPLPEPTGSLELSKLRIAWAKELGGVPVAQEIKEALVGFAAKLKAAGAKVEEAEPKDFPYEMAWETWGALVGAQGGYEKSNFMRAIGEFFTRSAVAKTPMQRKIVGPITVPSYMQALGNQDECMEALERFFDSYDVWIVPVSSTTAFPHHAPSRKYGEFFVYEEPLNVGEVRVPYYVATQSYTTLFSLTESPVVTIPLGRDRRGAHIGIQIVGRRYSDVQLIRMAKLMQDLVLRGANQGKIAKD